MLKEKIKPIKPLYEHAFYAMQLTGAYCLYYNMDFTEEETKKFQKLFIEEDNNIKAYSVREAEVEKELEEMYGFSCSKESAKIPVLTKIKLCGGKKRSKNIMSVIYSADISITSYMILSIKVLTEEFSFTKEDIFTWWNAMKEFFKYYDQGMENAHVIKYFMQEAGITINCDE